ncbi:MAG: sulfite exporter TauE/SafE family protein [Betaproteobacteria bacterium]|nr:sulfite exporter TauE/SafE family protein [Betaproteobacteria bacterium]MBV9362277.1 sulfite exporter TauE/SafE family protein [Betaproteobacteria bacterium]
MLALSLFLLGLASGVHCVGMCGGFIAAFSSQRVIAIQPATRRWQSLLLFNAGRITSYSIAGALAGLVGGQFATLLGAQTALYVLANLMFIAIGLHLAGVTSLSVVEKLGAPIWRRLQPLAAKAMSGGAYGAGLLWGWIPCGLVYGALAAAAFAGTAAGGALAMAAYGLGTLPWLLAGGFAITKTKRAVAGATVLAFGVYGLAHGADLRGLLCL